MKKYFLTAIILLAAAHNSVAHDSDATQQCVSIVIPAFNLLPDNTCSISSSELIRSRLPDQTFLYDLLGPTPETPTCFTITVPGTNPGAPDTTVPGTLENHATGEVIDITFSGIAGLTLNSYPAPPSESSLSFTAATLASIAIEDEEIGQLITRDAGTLFIDPDGHQYDNIAAARLAVDGGTYKFRRVTGYIDETGKEFNPFEPASARGILCGKELADKLFDKDLNSIHL